MNIILILILITLALIVLLFFLWRTISSKPENAQIERTVYHYVAKPYIMTAREADFFKTLNTIFGEKWLVIPQVHLSALLDHKVKGQNWSRAFRHINGKSVDFVLIGKDSYRTICAIELDDSSHDRTDRQQRDAEVERIFREAKIPLARFNNVGTITNQEIINTIVGAINEVSQIKTKENLYEF